MSGDAAPRAPSSGCPGRSTPSPTRAVGSRKKPARVPDRSRPHHAFDVGSGATYVPHVSAAPGPRGGIAERQLVLAKTARASRLTSRGSSYSTSSCIWPDHRSQTSLYPYLSNRSSSVSFTRSSTIRSRCRTRESPSSSPVNTKRPSFKPFPGVVAGVRGFRAPPRFARFLRGRRFSASDSDDSSSS